MAESAFGRRRRAWPNVLLLGGVVGVLIVSFLLVLSLIRSYVEPPRIPTARPILASAETPTELTGLAGTDLSVLDVARLGAIENLAAAMARGETPQPAAALTKVAEEPAFSAADVPLPPRRPRETSVRISGEVPIPRPRPQE